MKNLHYITLFVISIIFQQGCATQAVHNHYINPQDKLKSKTFFTNVTQIKWASSTGDKIMLCIYGDIQEQKKPNSGYIALSSYNDIQSSYPYLVKSKKTFTASFNKNVTKQYNIGNEIQLKATTIIPGCNKKTSDKNIKVIATENVLIYKWFNDNNVSEDFIYNILISRISATVPVRADYVVIRDLPPGKTSTYANNGKVMIISTLKIETAIVKNSGDTAKGILLYPFAILFDIVTFPFQLIGALIYGSLM